MNLDPRIKSLSDILTCFDIEYAMQYIGQKGYFSDDIEHYRCLDRCLDSTKYGTLTKIEDNDYPFREGNTEYWRFFIPESRLLKDKKKEFRPYTLQEFLDRFHIGEVIVVRSKATPNTMYHVLFVGYLENSKNEMNIILGQYRFSLQELFSSHDRFYNGRWVPFGVEVEE